MSTPRYEHTIELHNFWREPDSDVLLATIQLRGDQEGESVPRYVFHVESYDEQGRSESSHTFTTWAEAWEMGCYFADERKRGMGAA